MLLVVCIHNLINQTRKFHMFCVTYTLYWFIMNFFQEECELLTHADITDVVEQVNSQVEEEHLRKSGLNAHEAA